MAENESDFLQTLNLEFKKCPGLSDEVLSAGNINLYIRERVLKLLELTQRDGLKIESISIFISKNWSELLNVKSAFVDINKNSCSVDVRFFDAGVDTVLITPVVYRPSKKVAGGAYYSWRGQADLFFIAMSRTVSRAYFEARWGLQIVYGIDADVADKSAAGIK